MMHSHAPNPHYSGALQEIVQRIKCSVVADHCLLAEVRDIAEKALALKAEVSTRSETTIEYDESTGAFAVMHGGECMDWFPTRAEAEAFAKLHDSLPEGGA